MSRLTKRKYGEIVSSKREKKEIYCSNFCNNCSQGSGNCEYVKDMIEKLAEYEDLEEKGLLLKLPYNIANCGKVYFVDENDLEIYELLADKIEIYKMMISEKFVYTIDSFDFFYEDFGKTVFLTKEEAEKALKELERLNEQRE